jgi:hypothetical protein
LWFADDHLAGEQLQALVRAEGAEVDQALNTPDASSASCE